MDGFQYKNVILSTSDPDASSGWSEVYRQNTIGNQAQHVPTGVAFGNGKFVAALGSGHVITSTNGSSWSSPISIPGNPDLDFIEHAIDDMGNNVFIAGGAGGLWRSTTGTSSWNQVFNQTWFNADFYNGVWVAGGILGQIAYSTNNGVSWTLHGTGTGQPWNDVTGSEFGWVLVGGDSVRLVGVIPCFTNMAPEIFSVQNQDGLLINEPLAIYLRVTDADDDPTTTTATVNGNPLSSVGAVLFTGPGGERVWGDLGPNNDNAVNFVDVSTVSAAFNTAPGDANWNRLADLNNNEAVNFADYGIVTSNFNKTPASPDADLVSVIEWTPTAGQGGATYDFEVTADDGINQTSITFTVTVN